jgi:hypothetical protein
MGGAVRPVGTTALSQSEAVQLRGTLRRLPRYGGSLVCSMNYTEYRIVLDFAGHALRVTKPACPATVICVERAGRSHCYRDAGSRLLDLVADLLPARANRSAP